MSYTKIFQSVAKTESNVEWVSLAIESAGKLVIKLQLLNHPTEHMAIAPVYLIIHVAFSCGFF